MRLDPAEGGEAHPQVGSKILLANSESEPSLPYGRGVEESGLARLVGSEDHSATSEALLHCRSKDLKVTPRRDTCFTTFSVSIRPSSRRTTRKPTSEAAFLV